jgi:hypothetical protein
MTTYTYPRRNNSYFRYPAKVITNTSNISPNSYMYYSTAKKIAYAIKNYPARRSFYFNDWEALKTVALMLVKELGDDSCTIDKVEWNEFNITYEGNTFNILRKTSSDLVWNTYEITKVE